MIKPYDIKRLSVLATKAERLDNDEKNKYTMVAGIWRSPSTYFIGHNSYSKTHPLSIQPKTDEFYRFRHAEIHALVKFLKFFPEGGRSFDTVYVYGLTRAGNPVVSSCPCESCREALIAKNIRRVVYHQSDTPGELTLKELFL